VSTQWQCSQADHIPDDIRTKVVTSMVINAIVDRLGEADPGMQQAAIQALVELAKFGKTIC